MEKTIWSLKEIHQSVSGTIKKINERKDKFETKVAVFKEDHTTASGFIQNLLGDVPLVGSSLQSWFGGVSLKEEDKTKQILETLN